MININKGEANTVVLTLGENVTLSNPYFLFYFQNRQATEQQKYFNATDTSCDTERFNKFIITEDSTEDLDDGTVELKGEGQWNYIIYEVSTPTEKDPNNATATLESGLVTVFGTEPTVSAYDPTELDYVYEPND